MTGLALISAAVAAQGGVFAYVSPTCTFTPPSITSTRAGIRDDLTIPANEPVGTFLFAVQGEDGATIDTDTIEIVVQ